MSNNTLFPEIPTPEQVARYRKIRRVIDNYHAGLVPMAEVMALPKEEVVAARRWVTEMSIALLKKDLPDFGDDYDEDLQ